MAGDYASLRQGLGHLLPRVVLSGNATFEGVLIPTWDSFTLTRSVCWLLMERMV